MAEVMAVLTPLITLIVTLTPIVLGLFLFWRLVRALERIADNTSSKEKNEK